MKANISHWSLTRRYAVRCRDNNDGVSAVEFALISPLLVLMALGILDFGMAVYAKYNVDNGVTAASNFALQTPSAVSSTAGAGFATTLAQIVANSHATNWANATVTVNNGPVSSIQSGTLTTSGTAANADSCYCPTRSGTTITWGAAKSCGSSCSGGGYAGKFIVINASTPWSSVFGTYGVVQSSYMTSMAVVETQ